MNEPNNEEERIAKRDYVAYRTAADGILRHATKAAAKDNLNPELLAAALVTAAANVVAATAACSSPAIGVRICTQLMEQFGRMMANIKVEIGKGTLEETMRRPAPWT